MARLPQRTLAWVGPHDPLPDPAGAWSEPNGLLAAGADLSAARLLEAYRGGIFPWYTDGQPVLWWSPDPRMVLYLDEFRTSRSLTKTVRRARREARWRVTLDACFERVMRECAMPREPQDGTWITRDTVAAYCDLHRSGAAHSVEVWEDGRLVGGLYGVSIGRMFFGESMFTRVPDASKVALFALVQRLREHGFSVIDCQQNTRHLASLGAREISRASFLLQVAELVRQTGPDWRALGIDLPDA
ncbi:MAG: leucyl/phenylalanyl-tRNA--protein transferase [Burkholderiales bacterium]|nr:MAG: leucyl/phenylalanyl-tRNA--protein transferase [Burkholderiales bacterium]